MKAVIYEEFGLDLAVTTETPYYLAGFWTEPEMAKADIPLQNGEILVPGDEIAYIGGEKTSAGFELLFPVAPTLFRYEGIYTTLDGKRYLLWLPVVDGRPRRLSHPDYAAIYYAHGLVENYGGGSALLFTTHAGSGRVIETKEVYRSHEEIPGHVYSRFEPWAKTSRKKEARDKKREISCCRCV